MPSDKYSYAEGGFHYENLKSFIETGNGIKSNSDKPNPQYELTKEFVNEIAKLLPYSNLTSQLIEPIGTRFQVGTQLIKKYHKAYRCINGLEVVENSKKKVRISESEYKMLLNKLQELEELKEKLSATEESERMYKEETSELRTENIHLKNRLEEYKIKTKKAIQEIGYQRWIEL